MARKMVLLLRSVTLPRERLYGEKAHDVGSSKGIAIIVPSFAHSA